MTELSLVQARLIVAWGAVVIVLAFVGLISVFSGAASSPEGTARQYVQAEATQNNSQVADLTCTASRARAQLLSRSHAQALLASQIQRVDMNKHPIRRARQRAAAW